jgi:hypothetical protein
LNQQHLVALVCDRLRQFETRGGMAPVVLGIHTTHPTRTDATAGFGQNALTPILFRDHALSTKREVQERRVAGLRWHYHVASLIGSNSQCQMIPSSSGDTPKSVDEWRTTCRLTGPLCWKSRMHGSFVRNDPSAHRERTGKTTPRT